MSIYVTSDLHGEYKTFLAGLEKIDFNKNDFLYIIGDVIDRGPESIKLLKHIKRAKNMDLLIGNHEHMMLNSVNLDGKKKCDGQDDFIWLYGNGGDKTYEDYAKLSAQTRRSIINWLMERYVIKIIEVNGKKICLTHSYYYPDCENKKYNELSYSDVWDIVWRSIYRDDCKTKACNIYGNYDYIFVIGHVPVSKAAWRDGCTNFSILRSYRKKNVIDIDGGCAMGYQNGIKNGAIFLRLDDLKELSVPIVRYE